MNKEVRLKPLEQVMVKHAWMSTYKSASLLHTVDQAPIGSIIVVHWIDPNDTVSEPHERYIPMLVVGKTKTYARVTVIAGENFDPVCSKYNGITLNLNHVCAILSDRPASK